MMQNNTKDNINPTITLSPLQAHYLKRELISRQIRSELQTLSQHGALKSLGPPFTDDCAETDTPFLRFIFNRFVYTFPFLQNSNSTFWYKVSEFLNEFHKKNITNSFTRDETTKRKKLTEKIVNEFTLLLNAGLKTTSGKEESIKVDFSHIYEDYNKKNSQDDSSKSVNGWIVNIVSVKTASEKKRKIHNHIFMEYIIQTTRSNSDESVYVVRRRKDFKKLYTKLKEEFAAIDIPTIPNKIKERKSSTFNKSKSIRKDDPSNGLYQWEKNRQNLRAYLRSLLSIRDVARSKTMKIFLTDSPISLSEDEKKDIAERLELDSIRDEQKKKFNEEAEKRTKELEQHVSEFKKMVMGSGGLTEVIDVIQQTPDISDLPITYQKVIEWGEIGYASTLYSLFVGSDNSNETFAQLKRTHGLMPYRTIRSVLKLSNPVALMKGMLDVFLAQPFGQKSLAQRILSMNLTEDIKELGNDIKFLESEINDDEVCQKLRNYIYASSEIQIAVKKEAKGEDIDDLVLAILYTEALTPSLMDSQVAKFTGIINNIKIDNTDLLNDLKKLFFFYSRRRDKEMLIELLFQGVTGEILKEIITIFYEPLTKIYGAANISGSLTDLSEFVDDLINVVEDADRKGIVMYSPAESVVQTFISLVHRHIPKFYSFVYSVYSHDSTGLFNSLIEWVETLFNFMRNGLDEHIDLQQLIDSTLTTEEERTRVINEIESLMSWHTWRKKRRLMRLKNIMYNDIDSDNDGGESEDDDYVSDDDFVGIADDDDLESQHENDDLENSASDSDSMMEEMKFPEIEVIPRLLPPFVKLIGDLMRR
ncbi:PX domain protein [Rhizophagus clarus]|nr:PX domain protein [Rhizophagus clarus]